MLVFKHNLINPFPYSNILFWNGFSQRLKLKVFSIIKFPKRTESILGIFYFLNNCMAKNKTSETPHYEMLYIVSNKYSENEVLPIVQTVNKIIKKEGGTITYEESWGKKRLSYPIKHFNHGYYNLVEFDLEGKKLAKLNDLIRMSAEILRHQIVSKKKLTEEEIKMAKEKQKEQIKKTENKEKKEDDLKKEEKKGTVKLKDLDEKLDKILSTNDLL